MSKMLHILPVSGARVLDPDAIPMPDALPVEGKMVVDKSYWRRRLKAKEVELVAESVAVKEDVLVSDKKAGSAKENK